MLTTDVENYPGFQDGVMGPDLMMNFKAQAQKFGTEFITDKVTRVEFNSDPKADFSQNPHKIWVGKNEGEPDFTAQTVIISTGAQSIMLGIPNEDRLIGHGVSTCATCDGFFYKDQDIAVVGGGDSAMEESLFLTKFASSVTVIHRRDQLRASKIMADRAQANEKIKFLWNHTVEGLEGDTKLTGIKVKDTQNEAENNLAITGLFIAIGHKPNTSLFTGQLPMKDSGYLITEPNSTLTGLPGVFACGDVQDDYYRQAVTAAGSGCMAALDAERWLEGPH